MLRKAPLLVLILLAGILIGVTYMRTSGDAMPAPADTVAQAPAPAVLQDATQPAVGATATQPPREQVLQDMNARREAAAEKARARQLAYAAAYAREPVDARWAAAQESTLLAAKQSGQISQLQATPENLDIDCRTSMCRLKADFASRSQAEDWMTLFPLNAGRAMAGAAFEYSSNPDGTTRITVYSHQDSAGRGQPPSAGMNGN